MFVVALACLSVGVGAACYDGGGGFTLANWPRCTEASGNLSVYSGLSQDGQFVKLGLHAKGHTRGWSALGFAGNGGMKGASQIVVRIGSDGNWVAEDRFSLDYVTPTLDTKQDVQLLFATDNGMNTSWGVILPKDSCDVDDYSTENVSRTFLWALGASHAFDQHVDRGQFHANLVSAIVPFAPLTGVTEVSLRMNATVVSASSDPTNPYICGIFDLRRLIPAQNFSNKVHIAKFAPFLNPTTAGYVHHMILYGCNNNNFTHGDTVLDCESMPSGCNAFKWVWAVGSQDVQLPDNVGMPIGEGDFFVALQLHYYNPALINVVDTSGVTLSVVNTPRAIDAGLLQLNGGTNPSMRPDLPPRTPTFTIPTFVVPSTCTNTWSSPLNVIGAIHHMHLVGVHQEIEVTRGGVNLGPMRYERIWDFRHQSIEESLIGQLLAGDELRVTCQYDTSKKNVSTQFGESTDNEMCWSAVMYYPAQSFTTAAVQPVKTPAELRAEGAKCTNASTTYAAQNLSLCTELYEADPLLVLLGRSFAFDNVFLCNNLSMVSPTSWAQLQGFFPQICPACSADFNCTRPELIAYAQQVVCPIICDSLSLSLYPDQSRSIVYADHTTYCDGAANGLYRFNNTWPNRTCTPKGALNNSTAVSAVATPVLTTQNACPNAAIKNVLSRCAPSDFATGCVEQCSAATVALSAAFAAMAPVPSADQKLKCVSDFNSTWAPNSTAGRVWTQWTVLETQLRAGSPICTAEASVSGAGQTLPWALGVGSLLLCLFN